MCARAGRTCVATRAEALTTRGFPTLFVLRSRRRRAGRGAQLARSSRFACADRAAERALRLLWPPALRAAWRRRRPLRARARHAGRARPHAAVGGAVRGSPQPAAPHKARATAARPLTRPRCFAARAPLATGRRPLHSPQLINACAGAGAGASRLFSRWLQTHCRARDLTLSLSHAALLYGLAQAPLLLRLCARWTL